MAGREYLQKTVALALSWAKLLTEDQNWTEAIDTYQKQSHPTLPIPVRTTPFLALSQTSQPRKSRVGVVKI